jgi:hypothetical protein
VPPPRRWRFEVRLTLQTACPAKFACLSGTVSDGTGELSGPHLGLLLRELGPLDGMYEIAQRHELDVSVERVVIHPVDSHARDFASALLAVARAVRGHREPVPYVRKLVLQAHD